MTDTILHKTGRALTTWQQIKYYYNYMGTNKYYYYNDHVFTLVLAVIVTECPSTINRLSNCNVSSTGNSSCWNCQNIYNVNCIDPCNVCT